MACPLRVSWGSTSGWFRENRQNREYALPEQKYGRAFCYYELWGKRGQQYTGTNVKPLIGLRALARFGCTTTGRR